jgi:hypothetical protein
MDFDRIFGTVIVMIAITVSYYVGVVYLTLGILEKSVDHDDRTTLERIKYIIIGLISMTLCANSSNILSYVINQKTRPSFVAIDYSIPSSVPILITILSSILIIVIFFRGYSYISFGFSGAINNSNPLDKLDNLGCILSKLAGLTIIIMCIFAVYVMKLNIVCC